MQIVKNVDAKPRNKDLPNDELIDTLIAISIVAKSLAEKIKNKNKGEN